ncbi:MAG: cell division protein FtsQ/DivIB, partial [Gammaproteobacteria bacterium]
MLFSLAAALIALAVVIVLAVRYAKPLLEGPVLTELVIPGKLEHAQPQAVRAAVLSALGSGFFTTNVEAVQNAVQAVPWVASAAVRRSWPHTLYIDVTEELPVARWNGDGLMDAQGKVFVHAGGKTWPKLPLLTGPEGSGQDVLTQFNTFASVLTPRGLAILQLTVDARGDATLELSDGIQVRLGREDAELRLERFAAVALPTLSEKLATVAYVDMRYTNGFAVGYLPTCQWHVGDSERRGKDAAAGLAAMDGSQSCAPACVTAGQPSVTASQAQCAI